MSEGGPWRFGGLQDCSVAGLLRRLREASTPEAWREVLADMAMEVAIQHWFGYGYDRGLQSEEAVRQFRQDEVYLRNLVLRGFDQPPHRNREESRARHDAYVLAAWGKVATIAAARRFLMAAYQIPTSEAASRVKAAQRMGLELVPARRGRPPAARK